MVQGEGCGFKLGTNIESVLIVQTTSVGSCLHCFNDGLKMWMIVTRVTMLQDFISSKHDPLPPVFLDKTLMTFHCPTAKTVLRHPAFSALMSKYRRVSLGVRGKEKRVIYFSCVGNQLSITEPGYLLIMLGTLLRRWPGYCFSQL